MKNHYCFLHVIINLGDDACSNGLADLDKCCLPVDALNDLHAKSSSTTYAAILLAAGMLHQLGSEKYSGSNMFEAFLGMSDEDEDVATDHNNSPENAVENKSGSKSRKGTQVL